MSLLGAVLLMGCGPSLRADAITLPPHLDESRSEGIHNALVDEILENELADTIEQCMVAHPESWPSDGESPKLFVFARFDAQGRQTGLVAERPAGRVRWNADPSFAASPAFRCMVDQFSNVRVESTKGMTFSRGVQVQPLPRDVRVGTRRVLVDTMRAEAARTCPHSNVPIGWNVSAVTRRSAPRFASQNIEPAVAACLRGVVERTDFEAFGYTSVMREWVVVPFFLQRMPVRREGDAER